MEDPPTVTHRRKGNHPVKDQLHRTLVAFFQVSEEHRETVSGHRKVATAGPSAHSGSSSKNLKSSEKWSKQDHNPGTFPRNCSLELAAIWH
jgi:hypothetical protein